MMRMTCGALLTAVVLAVPAAATAQVLRATGHDDRVQAPPRVVEREREIERQRERARVAQSRNGWAHETERVSHTFRIGGDGELLVSNLSGDITVTRAAGNEVRIEAIKTARARTAEQAREMLPAVRVEFTERSGRAEAKAIYSREHFGRSQRTNVNVSVAYNITAPEATRIKASSLSGTIKVTGITGVLTLSTMSGDVGVVDAARISSAASTSGNVDVQGLQSKMPVELRSVSGNVIIRDSQVPSLELTTVSGDVTLDGVRVERLEAQSVSGNVHFASPLARGGRYELNSHSGDVRIVLLGGTGFELDANSFSGHVQSAVNLEERASATAGSGSRARPRRLRGIHGDGSALIDVTTFSGNVVITRK